MKQRFQGKQHARHATWDRLASEKIARFPFPPHGRIPNFAGAKEAAERLFHIPRFRKAKRIKVNPDAPQRYVRELALQRGITVYVPSPRLRSGFTRFDPKKIPKHKLSEAASLSKGSKWGEKVPLDELPQMDAIVTGSVAVTPDGHRCGKGEGYSDLEYGILRELGHLPVPVATTVHAIQLVESFPRTPTDLPLSYIVTPDRTIHVKHPPPPPKRIEWTRLTEESLEQMPVLKDLKKIQSRLTRPVRKPS